MVKTSPPTAKEMSWKMSGYSMRKNIDSLSEKHPSFLYLNKILKSVQQQSVKVILILQSELTQEFCSSAEYSAGVTWVRD